MADDVEEREDASPGASDDGLAEDREIAPAGRAGVGHGRHAAAKRQVVGINAALARIRIALAGAGEDVHVDIDEPGRHVKALHVHGLERRRRVDARGHGGDLAVADGDVTDLVDLVPGIDDVPAAQQQIILLPGHARCPRAHNRRSGATDFSASGSDLEYDRAGVMLSPTISCGLSSPLSRFRRPAMECRVASARLRAGVLDSGTRDIPSLR